MIDVIDVTKRFGRFTALSGLSLSVHKASIYGLVGINGARQNHSFKNDCGHLPAGGRRCAGECREYF